MDRESHMMFMGQSLHRLNTYVWRQLPPEYSIQVDTKKVMEAISYTNEQGKRVRLSDWRSAPNVTRISKERRKNEEVWVAYQERVRKFIPHVAGRPPRETTARK
jgi:hypothetical protein